jgi:hypothetical protein
MKRVYACLALLPLTAFAQVPGYFDVYIDHVKPERRSAYDAAIKKMVDYNRKHKGDTWITGEAIYGEGNTVVYNSARQNMAAIDDAIKAFRGAMSTALGGPGGMDAFFQTLNGCVNSSRAELRRPRPDLSTNQPSEADILKMVGGARYIRTFTIRVRPGKGPDYEKQLLMSKEAGERASRNVTLVSQGAGGQNGTVFYVTHILKALGDIDNLPSLQKTLGSQYSRYSDMTAANVISVESTIYRLLPELSNAPPPIAAVDPEFWTPKPKPAAAKPKPATGN